MRFHILGLSLYSFLTLLSIKLYANERMILEVGEQVSIELPFNPSRVVSSQPELAEALLSDTFLHVRGLRAGSLNITAWNENATEREKVEYDFVISPPERAILIHFLDVILAGSNVERLQTPESIWLSGRLEEKTFEQVRQLASSFQSLDVSQLTKIEKQPEMLIFNIQVAELKKSSLTQYGVNWSDSVNGPSVSLFTQFSESNTGRSDALTNLNLGWDFSLSSILSLLQQRGEARLLASPTIRSLENVWSEFHAGGEIPVPAASNDGNPNINFHPYGIKIRTKGEIDDQGDIKVYVDAEMSNLDSAVSINGIPGLLTRRSQSEVVVEPNEILILAGMKSQESFQSNNNTPLEWLGGSQEIRSQMTELVVFLQPNIVSLQENRATETELRTRHLTEQLQLAQCIE
ncbi:MULTISPECIES: pilus assembly protein N-terminal domain-containing protein [Gammaproteobacteria]|uniref:pilus assembly protein N-terminal domain-containing protein n=1 Tax=Gammaproteobacteria TaxID=1236 RepID=UPI000DD05C87|nr:MULTISPECIES: pilus assembly protein N-terminal domain-containing protein [Gammaproteobacteria]RTE87404.1 hypothetical protein DQX04_03185 [Aliidiomarina sp. B3213]